MPRIPQGTLFADEPINPTAYSLFSIANQMAQAIPQVHRIRMETEDRNLQQQRQAKQDEWTNEVQTHQRQDWENEDVNEFNRTWLPQLGTIERAQAAPLKMPTARVRSPKPSRDLILSQIPHTAAKDPKTGLDRPLKDRYDEAAALVASMPEEDTPDAGTPYTRPEMTDEQRAMIASALAHRGARKALGAGYDRWAAMLGPVGGADRTGEAVDPSPGADDLFVGGGAAPVVTMPAEAAIIPGQGSPVAAAQAAAVAANPQARAQDEAESVAKAKAALDALQQQIQQGINVAKNLETYQRIIQALTSKNAPTAVLNDVGVARHLSVANPGTVGQWLQDAPPKLDQIDESDPAYQAWLRTSNGRSRRISGIMQDESNRRSAVPPIFMQ